jgi:energy-coupling factor transport system permease protein
MYGFHTKAWLAWLVSSVLVVNALETPFAVPIIFGALAAVAGAFAVSGPESRSFATLVKIGLVFTVIRVLLFAATGHTGETTLFTTPEARLPRWLGDLRIGGRVTAEVALQSGLEGLRLAAFLACFGAFLAVTDVYRVLRLLPRFLAEAGLVVTIALAFTPTMFRAAGEIRDAQRLRGHRLRGARGALPLALPVLSSGLERSVTLAESMDVRGYGRRTEGFARVEAWARAATLAGSLALAGGGALYLFDRGPTAAIVSIIAVGAVALAAGLATLSRTIPRSRMRRERWVAWDWTLAGGALAAAAAAMTLRAIAPDATRYYPYPKVFWPPLHAGVVMIAATIALPALVGAVRGLRLGRAEKRHPQQPAASVAEAVGARR